MHEQTSVFLLGCLGGCVALPAAVALMAFIYFQYERHLHGGPFDKLLFFVTSSNKAQAVVLDALYFIAALVACGAEFGASAMAPGFVLLFLVPGIYYFFALALQIDGLALPRDSILAACAAVAAILTSYACIVTQNPAFFPLVSVAGAEMLLLLVCWATKNNLADTGVIHAYSLLVICLQQMHSVFSAAPSGARWAMVGSWWAALAAARVAAVAGALIGETFYEKREDVHVVAAEVSPKAGGESDGDQMFQGKFAHSSY